MTAGRQRRSLWRRRVSIAAPGGGAAPLQRTEATIECRMHTTAGPGLEPTIDRIGRDAVEAAVRRKVLELRGQPEFQWVGDWEPFDTDPDGRSGCLGLRCLLPLRGHGRAGAHRSGGR